MKHTVFLMSFFASILLYWKILPFSFTQDDFFLLQQAHFNSIGEQVVAALPKSDSIYFRPLGMQGYFFVAERLFGLHPRAYRLVLIFFHALNVSLIYHISRKLLSNSAWIVSTLYLFSPIHFLGIGWIANSSFVTGAFLMLLTIYMWLCFGKFKTSILLFTLGLLTNELAITTPLLLLVLLVVCHLSFRRQRVVSLFYMMAIDVLYVGFRIAMPRASTGAYSFKIGTNILQNVRWLGLWSLGWPETIRDYFYSLWAIRSDFVNTFPVATGLLIGSTVLFSVITVRRLVREPKIIVGAGWFLLAVSPVLLFTQHISPLYAIVGSLGLYEILAFALTRFSKRFQLIVMGLWIIQSLIVMRVNLITNWWVQHATLSESLIRQATQRYPIRSHNSLVTLYTPDPDRAEIVLAGDNALRLVYNDLTIKTVFVTSQ